MNDIRRGGRPGHREARPVGVGGRGGGRSCVQHLQHVHVEGGGGLHKMWI